MRSQNGSSFQIKKLRLAILPISLLLVLWACSGEENSDGSISDAQFCKCIKVTDKLNKFSAELLERPATQADAKKMEKLKDARTKECKRYFQMSGEEMRKRKAGCK